jgi:hypothetical protein
MPARAIPRPKEYYPKGRATAKTARVPRPDFGAPEQEVLTGFVQGKDASAPEERLCRGMDRSPYWRGYDFRRIIIAPARTVGSIEIDIWGYRPDGTEQAIKIDGDWVHARPAQVKKDKEDRDRIDNYLTKRGLPRLLVVPGHQLLTQEDADRTANEL